MGANMECYDGAMTKKEAEKVLFPEGDGFNWEPLEKEREAKRALYQESCNVVKQEYVTARQAIPTQEQPVYQPKIRDVVPKYLLQNDTYYTYKPKTNNYYAGESNQPVPEEESHELDKESGFTYEEIRIGKEALKNSDFVGGFIKGLNENPNLLKNVNTFGNLLKVLESNGLIKLSKAELSALKSFDKSKEGQIMNKFIQSVKQELDGGKITEDEFYGIYGRMIKPSFDKLSVKEKKSALNIINGSITQNEIDSIAREDDLKLSKLRQELEKEDARIDKIGDSLLASIASKYPSMEATEDPIYLGNDNTQTFKGDNTRRKKYSILGTEVRKDFYQAYKELLKESKRNGIWFNVEEVDYTYLRVKRHSDKEVKLKKQIDKLEKAN